MKVLYIGQYGAGSTSRMRGEIIKKILQPAYFHVVDIEKPIIRTNPFFRSLGWRYFKGPLISNINNHISSEIAHIDSIELVWVDKGVFIKPSILKRLRKKGAIIIHYTPDAAFYFNNSSLFIKSIPFYNFCVTTKSFEYDNYLSHEVKNLITCTQGYNGNIHHHYHSLESKEGIGFFGLYEDSRREILHDLIISGFKVKVGGKGWHKFNRQHHKYGNFTFLGDDLYGVDYAKAISGCQFALGLLSKKFPERHTTRTFEIPACKTILVTEDNSEIRSFYRSDEVLFYSDLNDMKSKIQHFLSNPDKIVSTIEKGYLAVSSGCFEYECIMRKILSEANII